MAFQIRLPLLYCAVIFLSCKSNQRIILNTCRHLQSDRIKKGNYQQKGLHISSSVISTKPYRQLNQGNYTSGLPGVTQINCCLRN